MMSGFTRPLVRRMAFGAACLVAACGGGSDPATPARFDVANFDPPADATSIPVGTSVQVVTSSGVDPDSASSLTFVLTADGAPIAGTVAVDGAAIVFRPEVPLAGGTTYTASLDPGVRGKNGARLGARVTSSFTTAHPPAAASVTALVPSSPPSADAYKFTDYARLRWSHPGGADGFVVEQSTDGGPYFTRHDAVPPDSREIILGVTTNGGCADADLRVRARTLVGGLSAPSNAMRFRTSFTNLALSAPSASSTSYSVAIADFFYANLGCPVNRFTGLADCPRYFIEEAADPSFATTLAVYSRTASVASPGSTTLTVSKQVGTSGTFCYRARRGTSTGCWSKPACVVVDIPDVDAPSIPTDLAAMAGEGSVALSWSSSADDVGVRGYRVHPTSPAGASWDVVGTSAFEDGLASASQHCYQVSAFDAAGNESARTAHVCATIPDTSPPSTPADVVATGWAESTISWSASTDDVGVHHYDVYAKIWYLNVWGDIGALLVDDLGQYQRIGQPVTTSFIQQFGLGSLLGGRYTCFKVVAVDAAGNASPASAVVCNTTL